MKFKYLRLQNNEYTMKIIFFFFWSKYTMKIMMDIITTIKEQCNYINEKLDLMNRSRLLMTWKTLNQELRVGDDMNDSGFWSKDYRYYNILRLWLTWTTIGRAFKALNVVNSSRLSMIWATLGLQLRALDTMSSTRLWLI